MITSWGQITPEWIGKRVVVRWEEPSQPLADGHNSGIPHEITGAVRADGLRIGLARPINGWTRTDFNIPERAHVQEVTE